MLGAFSKISLSVKTGLMVVFGYTVFGLAIIGVTFAVLDVALMKQAQDRMSINMSVAHATINKYGTDFSIKDGKLSIGERVLNDDNSIPDQIVGLVGGVATIFMGDQRVATNIITAEGKRAIGTKLAKGTAYDTVIGKGKTFRGEAEILGATYLTAYDPILDSKGETIGIVFVGMKKSDQLALIGVLVEKIAITIVVIGLLMSLGAYLTLRIQLKPLNKLNLVIEKLQKEDLSAEVPALKRKDEIGTLAKGIQSFKEGIADKMRLREEHELHKKQSEEERHASMRRMADDFERDVKNIVATVSAAATEMQGSSKSMSLIATDTSQKASAVATAAGEASTNIQTVAFAVEQLDSSIGEINKQIGDSVRVASSCVTEAEATSEVMQNLSKSADDIGNVVKLIEDIASQVNLLALNATIEAARAGEAGRGFAVVANEVKNLANQVGSAARDITTQINGIQGQTGKAVETIANITHTIRKINEISTTIASAAEEQDAATKEISRSIKETAEGTDKVTKNISSVTQATKDTSAASGQVFETAGKLAEKADVLKKVVDGFITKVRAG